MPQISLHAVCQPGGIGVTAHCSEVNIQAEGMDESEAIANLRNQIQALFTQPFVPTGPHTQFTVSASVRLSSGGNISFGPSASTLIPAGFTDLRRIFYQHDDVQDTGTTTSHFLLLFYCVECGLKAAYLRANSLQTISQIHDETLLRSHNLQRWIKELRLPRSQFSNCPTFRLNSQTRDWEGHTAHQAWRYGARMEEHTEGALRNWLLNVVSKLKEDLL